MRSSQSWLLLCAAFLAAGAIVVWQLGFPGSRPGSVAVSSTPEGLAPLAETTPMPESAPPPALPAGTPVPIARVSPAPTVPPPPGVPPRIAARASFAPPPVPGGFQLTERDYVATEIRSVQDSLRTFRNLLGENPVGTNAEITKALLGDNPKHAQLGLPPGSQLNGAGELCDRWGSPYFFHQMSAEKMEVRSAGPDRTMWTEDDMQQ